MTVAVLRPGAGHPISGGAVFGRRYWKLVMKLALLGPLIGGAPYNVFVILIPFSYAFGIVPSTLSALAYAYWLQLPTRRQPGVVHRSIIGAVVGMLGCAATAALADLVWPAQATDRSFLILCAPHALLAGVVLGAWSKHLDSGGGRDTAGAGRVPPLSTPWRADASK